MSRKVSRVLERTYLNDLEKIIKLDLSHPEVRYTRAVRMRYSKSLQTSLTGFGPRDASSVDADDIVIAFLSDRGTSRMGVGRAARSDRGRPMMDGKKVA